MNVIEKKKRKWDNRSNECNICKICQCDKIRMVSNIIQCIIRKNTSRKLRNIRIRAYQICHTTQIGISRNTQDRKKRKNWKKENQTLMNAKWNNQCSTYPGQSRASCTTLSSDAVRQTSKRGQWRPKDAPYLWKYKGKHNEHKETHYQAVLQQV